MNVTFNEVHACIKVTDNYGAPLVQSVLPRNHCLPTLQLRLHSTAATQMKRSCSAISYIPIYQNSGYWIPPVYAFTRRPCLYAYTRAACQSSYPFNLPI